MWLRNFISIRPACINEEGLSWMAPPNIEVCPEGLGAMLEYLAY